MTAFSASLRFGKRLLKFTVAGQKRACGRGLACQLIDSCPITLKRLPLPLECDLFPVFAGAVNSDRPSAPLECAGAEQALVSQHSILRVSLCGLQQASQQGGRAIQKGSDLAQSKTVLVNRPDPRLNRLTTCRWIADRSGLLWIETLSALTYTGGQELSAQIDA